jgi:hypothetical protein
LYGDLGTLNTVEALGFNYYDSTGAGCDCAVSTVEGDATVTNLVAPFFDTTEIMIDTSDVTDTVSQAIGIDNFCGEYSFSIDTNPTGGTVDSSIELCEEDCGNYNNYTLASVTPI